ncbi:MAG: hypothetical protein HS113_22430 [Verrucomicrobiales bacterium]|nr:hypothetical protein [Verrucomicrobiales bacterium]
MKHITVLLEAPARDVADLAQVLADRGVNIEDIDVEESEQTGVANLTVDHYDVALQALRDAGFRAVSEDALVIRLKDEPGALAKVAVRFKAAGIGIRSMHILGRAGSAALVTIVCERPEEAKQLVRDLLVSGV